MNCGTAFGALAFRKYRRDGTHCVDGGDGSPVRAITSATARATTLRIEPA